MSAPLLIRAASINARTRYGISAWRTTVSVDLVSLALTNACCAAFVNRFTNTDLDVSSSCIHCCSFIATVAGKYITHISASVFVAMVSRSVAALDTVI